MTVLFLVTENGISPGRPEIGESTHNAKGDRIVQSGANLGSCKHWRRLYGIRHAKNCWYRRNSASE